MSRQRVRSIVQLTLGACFGVSLMVCGGDGPPDSGTGVDLGIGGGMDDLRADEGSGGIDLGEDLAIPDLRTDPDLGTPPDLRGPLACTGSAECSTPTPYCCFSTLSGVSCKSACTNSPPVIYRLCHKGADCAGDSIYTRCCHLNDFIGLPPGQTVCLPDIIFPGETCVP